MTVYSVLMLNLTTIGTILAAMALIALVEVAIPLHARGRWHRAHLVPNLALTSVTFLTNVFLNAALVLLLVWLTEKDFGVLRGLGIAPVVANVVAVVALDFSFYVAHVAMHRVPVLWKFHSVHHADPAVDVTTTIRQHPGEGLIRYAFMATCAVVLGVGIEAFAVYRAWSALSGLLEHANVRIPRSLDAKLSWLTTWPNMHKVHHSRDVRETDTNYGNIFPWFDRLLGTYTDSSHGEEVRYGLDGLDDPQAQSVSGLLALPFRSAGAIMVRTSEATEQRAISECANAPSCKARPRCSSDSSPYDGPASTLCLRNETKCWSSTTEGRLRDK